jgi:lipoate-protein ligase A
MRRRAEYKTPGGKLIAIEFALRDGVIRDVVVTGDFFLYPEEALPSLASSLDGASAQMTDGQFAERVRQALSGDIELLGSSPEALAIAVRRALADDGSGSH